MEGETTPTQAFKLKKKRKKNQQYHDITKRLSVQKEMEEGISILWGNIKVKQKAYKV